jgi:hypothetical protein
MQFCYGEHIYSEGSETRDIYLTRKGEFCYEVRNHNEEKQV